MICGIFECFRVVVNLVQGKLIKKESLSDCCFLVVSVRSNLFVAVNYCVIALYNLAV